MERNVTVIKGGEVERNGTVIKGREVINMNLLLRISQTVWRQNKCVQCNC